MAAVWSVKQSTSQRMRAFCNTGVKDRNIQGTYVIKQRKTVNGE